LSRVFPEPGEKGRESRGANVEGWGEEGGGSSTKKETVEVESDNYSSSFPREFRLIQLRMFGETFGSALRRGKRSGGNLTNTKRTSISRSLA